MQLRQVSESPKPHAPYFYLLINTVSDNIDLPWNLLDSPMENLREEDLEIGSCLSSPAASVLSDFSEIVYAQSPSKHRGVKIY